MSSKESLLQKSSLYLILDTEVADYAKLLTIAQEAVDNGIDIVQLRDKKGSVKDILKFSKDILKILKGKLPYIVNDRVDLAIAALAQGVHLGQEDLDIGVARKMIGKKAIIGASCQTLEAAYKAENEGADYIGFGSVFKTFTKPGRSLMDLDILKEVINKIRIPVFAIGGIHQGNIENLIHMGVRRVAVCRAILQAADVGATTRSMVDLLHS